MFKKRENNRIMSIKQLFIIYLKAGKKRIILSFISGILIFLTIITLIMVVYTHRFNEFQDFELRYYDWYNDDKISVGTNFIHTNPIEVENDTFNQFVAEFQSMVSKYVPNIGINNYTAAISTEIYTFDPYMPGEPWINHEFMAVDDRTYQLIINNFVEGRLPQNKTELLCFRRGLSEFSLNETITIYTKPEINPSYRANYTIVGLVDKNIRTIYKNESFSCDILDWYFSDLTTFYNYYAYNTFLMNYSTFQEIFTSVSSYDGVLTYLLDINYDTTNLQLNKLSTFITNFPNSNNLPHSLVLKHSIVVGPDLHEMLSNFVNIWVFRSSKIMSLNSPLIFLIGLLLVITLTIGSRGLKISFRRMKIYGLSYKIVRRLIIFENLIFTSASFLIGTLIGSGISVLSTYNIEKRPFNFYNNFLQEPLLYISLGVFLIGFFFLNYYIQNSIAKHTTKTSPEEFKEKRKKIRSIFTTNEFRILVFGFLFTIFSISFYSIYRFWGSKFVYTTTFTYLTFMWFMISFSLAFLLTFLSLLLARLFNLMWTSISQRFWRKKLNLISLSFKHIAVSRGNYQLAILGALIFGLVIFPGLTINQSINSHIQIETELKMGSTNLIIPHWVDPENKLDYLFENITGIECFTDITTYVLEDDNLDLEYPKAFKVTLIGLESPMNFTNVVDMIALNETQVGIDDIISLENDSNILMNEEYAESLDLKPGDFYQTNHFTYFNNNLSLINTYKYFLLTPLSIKPLFDRSFDIFSIVANKATVLDIVQSSDFETEVSVNTVKIIKVNNELLIPSIKRRLAELNLKALSFDDVYNELFSQINHFAKNNIQFFALLSTFTIIFIGFYTGISIFEERGQIIDSLYRTGAYRRQILGIFTLEILILDSIPILVTILLSIPLMRFISSYYLGVKSIYSYFSPRISWWLILLLFLAGIILSLLGWLIALIPAIYRFKPVKQV